MTGDELQVLQILVSESGQAEACIREIDAPVTAQALLWPVRVIDADLQLPGIPLFDDAGNAAVIEAHRLTRPHVTINFRDGYRDFARAQ